MTQSNHCHRFRPIAMTRRQMLRDAACGFGSVALAALMADKSYAGLISSSGNTLHNHSPNSSSGPEPNENDHPLAPKPTHFAPRVKRIVYLYMDGGPSQIDTFDPKPQLAKEHGEPFKMKIEPTQFNNIGKTLQSPWKFKQHGECGTPVSELFPNVAKHVDDLAVIRSMVSEFSEHTAANYFLHTGNGFQGRPSMGAWLGYGLGSECRDLPGFIVLNGGLIPPGGLDCFNSGFLPATYQGSIFNAGKQPLANIVPREKLARLQQNKLALLKNLDQENLQAMGSNSQIESAISNYELAYRMQSVVPEMASLDGETDATKKMYGLEAEQKSTQTFGRQCLLARRLLEKGVRFIELTCPGVGHDRWDQHNNLKKGHAANAIAVDQGIGALLTDLKQRGMFEDTLVVWSGEFGRTPFAQGTDGRDHNPFGFSLWMAGGGVKGGTIHGATDEYGYKTIENKVEIYDLHATMLHLLGMDHKKLTYQWGGRDMRLTDVHGRVVYEILA